MKTTRIAACSFVVLLTCLNPLGAPAAASEATTAGPVTVRFERKWEANERAFSFLLPAGWTTQGGLFHVNPLQAGGPGNSIDAKCDLTLRKDATGTIYFRWLPAWNYVDMSQNPQMAIAAGMYRAGSNYQGMEVRPMPGYAEYLRSLFARLHPNATEVKVVQVEAIPELNTIFERICKPVNDQLRMMGSRPLRFDAGGLVVEYSESNQRFREAVVTCLVDFRYAAALWSNQYTLAMRAPAAEAQQWKPVFDIIRQSLRFDPKWLAAASKAAAGRGQTVLDTMKEMQRIDQQIYEQRTKTNANIQHENYLLLTDQEEYVNPFTGNVEQDTAEYKRRWTTEQGDMIYTDSEQFNPNAVTELNHQTWKLTPVRPR